MNQQMEGGPLNPKETVSEKTIAAIFGTVLSKNNGAGALIATALCIVYGAITTFVSQWQSIPEALIWSLLELLNVLLTKSL